ncbi:uncharacterized protein EV420DRAFT_1274942 [Desarmillaria tabescens]|uniref:Helitron helicase-like domain-containing protein n=1 Tax=Armillaria tabescens TaxID=1929756 RepID=A0AA39JVQ4_ARMTA|nr:uncharacterized protein EV420DRAFT_1274942 [Desarmillaria tabescens]KAK0449811.1 hypothetical protein EV420DRAFT_1274942 [Desarmillaria tabescens]
MPGLFGDTSAYYGTVEQQGQLTLHLHMIIWIRKCLSPQEIRDHLLSDDSEFQIRLIQYLESVHKGDYFTGAQDMVLIMRHKQSLQPGYYDFTEVLPNTPPSHCDQPSGCADCKAGNTSESWWGYFRHMVDMIINKCNIHSCHSNTWADGTLKQNANVKGCLDNKWKKCKACFPRKIVKETTVDKETSHINIIKKEAWINTFTPLISYIFCCNTDVTSLHSGTAIKAVLVYVTDYIIKPGLKMHAIFECI